jgi:hypothetical protein
VGVPVEQPERDLVKRGLGGADLGEDVDAVLVRVSAPQRLPATGTPCETRTMSR